MKIPLCKLYLDHPLKRSDLRRFRAQVSEALGPGNVLFHNHTDDDARPLRYRYPLVQYKVLNKKAAIIGIAEGALAVREQISPDGVHFAGNFEILSRLDENYQIGLGTELQPYYLAQWLALNPDNAKRWQSLSGEAARTPELERILAAHILSFASGIGYHVPGPKGLVVEIQEWAGPRRASYHGKNFHSFDVRFSCNLTLPFDIGLGKAASHGFGCVWKPRKSILKKRKINKPGSFVFDW